MDFSNSTTEIGLIQEVDRLCGTVDATYSLKAKTARINDALSRFAYLAMMNDRVWQFDDLNNTDLPIGVADLVSAQQDYEFADEVLMIQKVMVKDSSGVWSEISPIDMDDPDSKNIWTLPSGNTGTPLRYANFAHSLLLDPIPNYASTGGLKVVFKRNLVAFVSTDTTTDPGIPSIFHPYLARYAALPYCITKGLKQAGGISSLVQQDERAIEEFFGMRSQDTRTRMTPHIENTR